MAQLPSVIRSQVFNPFFGSRRLASRLCVALFIVSSIVGCKKKPQPPPPPDVQVITIQPTNVPIFEEWIGTLDGLVNAQIRAQVTGYLLSQNYQEGGAVKKGDLLFQIDPHPFQDVLDQTKAKLAQDQAQFEKAQADVTRYTPLAKQQAISQEELDNAVHASAAAQAQVNADDATIKTAEWNLSLTKVTSPIDGIAGLALAQIGDLVSPSSGVLTTVSTLDPIKVYFQINEQTYVDFWLHNAPGTGAETNLDLQLILSTGTTYSRTGHVFFSDRQVNPNTGTLQIAGLFPNPNSVLRPGQYGRVRALTQTKTNALVVPQRAVAELQGTYQVTIVGDQNKAHVQPVKTGPQIGDGWIIEEGLQPGAHVIVEGLQKAKEGAVVNPLPFGANTNQPPASKFQTNSDQKSQPPK